MEISPKQSIAQISIQLVIMDALEKGHTKKEDLIQYMKSNVFETAVKTYIALFEKEFKLETIIPKELNTGSDKTTLLETIKNGTHPQFLLNEDKVECKCGHVAIWVRTGYLCGTITAYPCKYNKTK